MLNGSLHAFFRLAWGAGLILAAACARGADLAETITQVKPSVVGIGTFLKLRNPNVQFTGTGFAVGDGRYVVTNFHVVAKPLDEDKRESRIVLVSQGGEPSPRGAEVLATDREHDLAVLRLSGEPLPPLAIGDSGRVREGRALAFTGFPIGMVLGFHPATHRAMVAAITPVALPGITARQLTAKSISRIRDSAYRVFQLDGTAYPGNSGSPLYDPDNGTVYGIINAVFVQGTREAAISRPSGITYAIPAAYIRDLLREAKVPGFAE
ncbi:MAG: trypsin-like peptidase domain-containing protein [Burkholderiales bacterium]|nr:trypsin-like peptidase domain-containing protein [Burkholderiales bacterium]